MAAEDTIINSSFYAPWPHFGRKSSQQWGEIRTDTAQLAPLVRGAGLDAGGDFSTLTSTSRAAVQAWEIGQQDFHNKFRIHYDKTDNLFEIEYNSGTEAIPVWNTYFTVDSLGNVTGGGAGEANTASNLGADTYGLFASKSSVDLQFKSLIAGTGITLSASGTEITITSTSSGSGDQLFYLTAKQTDGSASFSGLNVLNFNSNEFYLTQNASNTDEVVINLRDITASGETNTASNIGAGAGVFAQKSIADLEFKSIRGWDEAISITSDADEIFIGATGTFYQSLLSVEGPQSRLLVGDNAARDSIIEFFNTGTLAYTAGYDYSADVFKISVGPLDDTNDEVVISENVVTIHDHLVTGDIEAGTGTFYTSLSADRFIAIRNGTSSEAAFAFETDGGDTGIFLHNPGVMRMAVNGTHTLDVTASRVYTINQLLIAAANNPAIPDMGFILDTNTGLYQVVDGNDTVDFSSGGTWSAGIGPLGLNVLKDVKAGRVEAGIGSFYTSLDVDGYITTWDEAYAVSWDGNLTVPTKNALYDKIENLKSTIGGFYLTVKQSDDSSSFSGLSLINFNVGNFYLTQNSPNTDEVLVNFRGASNDIGAATRELDNLRNTAVNADIIPDTDETWDLGSLSTRFAQVNAKRVFAVDGAGTLTQTYAGVLSGYAGASGTLASTNRGAVAFGYSDAGTITSTNLGSFSQGAASAGTIESTGLGSFSQGYITEDTGTALMSASGSGAFAQGYIKSDTNTSWIKSTAVGSFAQGFSSGSGAGATTYLEATANGSFAHGTCSGTNGTTNIIRAYGNSSFAVGRARSTKSGGTFGGYIIATGNGSTAMGDAVTLTAGTAHSQIFAGTGVATLTTGVGAFAQGQARSGTIQAWSDGSFAQGSVTTGGVLQSGVSTNLAIGNFAQGAVSTSGTLTAGGITSIYPYAYGGPMGGSFSQGFCVGGQITADGNGCFAQGYVGNPYNTSYYGFPPPSSGSNYIKATYGGNFAQGWAGTFYDYTASHVLASAYGAFAQGIAWGGNIEATGPGSFAQGNSAGTGDITSTANGSFAQGAIKIASTYGINATANGAFAHGYAGTASIVASAINSAQFGEGTNAEVDTLAVGTGIRFKGTAGPTGTPRSGDIWSDSGVQKTLQTFLSGVEQNFPGVLFTQTANATVTANGADTTLVGTGVGTVTLPANFFVIGKTIRVKMSGYNSTTSPAGNLTMKVKLGSTTVLTTAALAATDSLSNRAWDVEGVITCRTTGASGTVFSQGKTYRNTAAKTSSAWQMVNTATTTIDTTASQAVSVTVLWANTGNSMTSTNFTLEVLN